MTNTNSILLTIDVEDWFQVENFKQCIPFSSWQDCELRVEKNTHRLLDLLDSVNLHSTSAARVVRQNSGAQSASEPRTNNPGPRIYATFFVLGWIAERLPNLIREIHIRGHEVASHGYHHNLCSQQSGSTLKKDLTDSKKLLEDVVGWPIVGYRAPSFSINNDILKIVQDCGYIYDSSFNSFGLHNRYGRVVLPQYGNIGIACQVSHTFYELPISNLTLFNFVVPWGGGGYFRLLPSHVFSLGVQSILDKKKAFLLYLHPWELDPDQPRVIDVPKLLKFRHYINLDKTVSKLSHLIQTFKQCSFSTCRQYINKVTNAVEGNTNPLLTNEH